MHQGRERHHQLLALSRAQGIETGKTHHNVPSQDTSGYYATSEPFQNHLSALHEQGWPGELARARELASQHDAERRLAEALAGRTEADVLAAFAHLPEDI